MDIRPEDRPKVKAECLRLLVTLRLDPARTQLISGFIDSYLRLNEAEQALFTQELGAFEPQEQEGVMEIVTSWMEQGIERGIEQGMAQAQREAIARMVERRFSVAEIADIVNLPPERVEAIINSLGK
ncbi:hypothetical protein [Spirulina subsalsa]|uniref:hypothetical protein n=1 Tax=Spirulina subsalsa TaxID=54311 RepID=UPI00037FF7FA|nr:hypothetical protein [Spirulina subsalsa]